MSDIVADSLVASRPIVPVRRPVVGDVTVPGSKSITNRALALAALCDGETTLTGALFADDTARMADCLRALGFSVRADPSDATFSVTGAGGRIPATEARLFVGNSGTTARFITPIAALGHGTFTLDGVARMRERPIGDLVDALANLGVEISCPTGCPPLTLHATGLRGGTTQIRGDASSQFLSGLLLAAPCADADETRLIVDGPLLSAPYVELTVKMMRAFGANVEISGNGREFVVPGRQNYVSPGTYPVEPDASSASYFFAAAAVTGGHVGVRGLSRNSLQGDAKLVDVLEKMGATIRFADDRIEVSGPETLSGVTVDMNEISDTMMTIAAIAPFASSPTTIENVGHVRHKETDRLAAVAAELSRLGVAVDERPDSITIHPAPVLKPARIETYDDHRMAMAFSITGLKADGVTILDPNCVDKTFPTFFDVLDDLVSSARRDLPWTIAIDGPAGAGKSTLAKRLAARLGFVYIDSGAMYRAVAFAALRIGLDPGDASGLGDLAERVEIAFSPAADGSQRVLLSGDDITDAIRTPELSAAASRVSVHPDVRSALVRQQQALGEGGGVVMEGRDIGSVVFPRAQLKVFLTASDTERARRRLIDLQERGDSGATFESVLADQIERDARDSTRVTSPLLAMPDARIVNTDGREIDELVDEIGAWIPAAGRLK